MDQTVNKVIAFTLRGQRRTLNSMPTSVYLQTETNPQEKEKATATVYDKKLDPAWKIYGKKWGLS